MLYHKLHWGATGGAEFLLGAAPWLPFEPPLFVGPQYNIGSNNNSVTFLALTATCVVSASYNKTLQRRDTVMHGYNLQQKATAVWRTRLHCRMPDDPCTTPDSGAGYGKQWCVVEGERRSPDILWGNSV